MNIFIDPFSAPGGVATGEGGGFDVFTGDSDSYWGIEAYWGFGAGGDANLGGGSYSFVFGDD